MGRFARDRPDAYDAVPVPPVTRRRPVALNATASTRFPCLAMGRELSESLVIQPDADITEVTAVFTYYS